MEIMDLEIPTIQPKSEESCGTCGTHTCKAIRHIDDVAHDLDVLRAELRRSEKQRADDCRKLWFRIGGILVALAAVVPTGWASFLGMI